MAAKENKTKANKAKKKKSLPKSKNEYLLSFANDSKDDVVERMESTYDGLLNDEAEDRIEKYGYNVLSSKNKNTWYKILFESFFNVFSLILIVIAILNVTIPGIVDWAAFGIIISMVFISGILKFVQENKSNGAMNKLNKMISNTANIEREGIQSEIAMSEIVPGDIVSLAAGDMIPADMRVLYAKDLFITQSSLTGESEPVEKTAQMNTNTKITALEASNLCFMGTTVASGIAKGIVINTGKQTYLGSIAGSLNKKRPKTSFDKGIKKVSWLLIQVMVVMVLAVFLINGFIKDPIDGLNPWIESLIFALSIAVGLTPEMLPMIVTLNLSKEAIRFSKLKTVVKNINSIQTFGAMDILCTDKTGTLTEDKIILQQHINVDGKQDNRVLNYGYLNSYFQTGLKNLLDKAIIEKAEAIGLDSTLSNFSKIDEIPFDFSRRRMSIILKDKSNINQLITKGAVEEILSICKYVETKGEIKEITDKEVKKIKKSVDEINENGMRVIAVARNYNEIGKEHAFCAQDETNMVLIGYIALLDPPKMSAKTAVAGLQKKGVEIKILTGDNEKVTCYICNQLNIKNKGIIQGVDVENMSDDQLRKEAKTNTIFAKLTPEQKARVVAALKFGKHSVGFMGDGINDAPAMRESDLAISVDTAVDIAKESADVILLEKDLTILEKGVVEGRKTYANITKYIKLTVSSNFGNMLSMLIASIWLPFMPLQAVQILALNLFYDFSQLSMSWDNVDQEFLEKPQNWNARSILKFMLWIGPISTIFDLTTFAILYYGFGLNGSAIGDIAIFNSCWFIECAITQIIVIYILRTPKIPFVQSSPSWPVVVSTLSIAAASVTLPFIPGFNSALDFSSNISLWFILWLSLIVAGYIIFVQLGKMIYIRQYRSWL